MAAADWEEMRASGGPALLTAYRAAVFGNWKRARFIGAFMVGFHALLFVALAGVMYATRHADRASVGRHGHSEVRAE